MYYKQPEHSVLYETLVPSLAIGSCLLSRVFLNQGVWKINARNNKYLTAGVMAYSTYVFLTELKKMRNDDESCKYYFSGTNKLLDNCSKASIIGVVAGTRGIITKSPLFIAIGINLMIPALTTGIYIPSIVIYDYYNKYTVVDKE